MRLFRCDVQMNGCDASDYRGMISGSGRHYSVHHHLHTSPAVLAVQAVTLTEDKSQLHHIFESQAKVHNGCSFVQSMPSAHLCSDKGAYSSFS